MGQRNGRKPIDTLEVIHDWEMWESLRKGEYVPYGDVLLLNLTGRLVKVMMNGEILEMPPLLRAGEIMEARVQRVQRDTLIGLGDVRIVAVELTGVVDLPAENHGVFFVVNEPVVVQAKAFGRGIEDLLIPSSPGEDGVSDCFTSIADASEVLVATMYGLREY